MKRPAAVLHISEHDLQNAIRSALEWKGYFVARGNVGKMKTPDGRWFDTGLPKGWSDLVAFKNGRAYFIEVKSGRNKATPEQEQFLDGMRALGFAAGVARSVDEAMELVGEPRMNIN